MLGLGLRELLFLASGVTAAAGVGAYVTGVLDPLLGRTPPAVVAALPDTPAPPREQPPVAGEPVPKPEQPAVVEEAEPVVPTFDVVRLEPDGSLVVAGRAAPGATVELVAGETVLATAIASPEGDFAIVLDEPLAPGDYQIALRATTPDNVVTVSVESAVVSVPEQQDGQVLVLVDQPGAPAELLTVPDAPEAPAEEEVADLPPAEEAVEETPPAEEETVEAPPAEQDVAEAPPVEEAEEEVVQAPIEDEAPPAEAEIAALPQDEPEPEPARPEPAIVGHVAVEAVEIEGDTIFVAGQADPLRFVRVYANEILLGETRASEVGRFLVEARRELPVGEYAIRADLLDDNGVVLARAVVPFEREPGETIAAVAPPAPEPEVAEEQEIVAAPEPEQPEAAEEEVVAAPEPEVTEEEIAVAPEPEQPEVTEEEIVAAPEPEQPEVTEEEIVAAPEPEQPEVAEEEVVAAPEPEQPEVTEEEIVAAPEPEAEPEVEIAAAPEVTAPKLQRVDGSVIIRRGDSLWRISRRVYGRGVRYSTIYLANQGQISDPHRIWPGQVFAVPRETPEGDTADMGAISDQAAAPSEERMSGQ